MLISSKIKPLTLFYSGRYMEIWIHSITIIIICESTYFLSSHIILAAFSTSLSAVLVSCKLCWKSTQSFLSSTCVCNHIYRIYVTCIYSHTYSCIHIHWFFEDSEMYYYFLFTFQDHYKDFFKIIKYQRQQMKERYIFNKSTNYSDLK